MRPVKINIGIGETGNGVVFVDGHDVSHATTHVSFSAGPGELTKITLTMAAEILFTAENMTYVPIAQLPPTDGPSPVLTQSPS